MIRARIHAIACGYEDTDDLDTLRADPALKLACGRLPETGADLCSQPTLSRMENAPKLKDAIRLTHALVDQWMASYTTPPACITLDIYDTEKCRPVAVVLRPGKTPCGVEVRAHLRRLVRQGVRGDLQSGQRDHLIQE